MKKRFTLIELLVKTAVKLAEKTLISTHSQSLVSSLSPTNTLQYTRFYRTCQEIFMIFSTNICDFTVYSLLPESGTITSPAAMGETVSINSPVP